MKKLYNILLLTILCVNYNYSQVSNSIVDVSLNSQNPVANCSTIDFGTSSNNSLAFFYRLEKSSNGYCSEGNLKIMLKYSSSTNGSQRGSNIYFTTNSWDLNNRAEGYIYCNISATEVQVSGSSIYLEYTDCSNNKTTSCEYPIIKTPTPSFTLTPTNLALGCEDTSSRTFSVSPSNIPNGANVTYSWSHSGWSLISSSTTTRTLQPNSGTMLPSSVSVTPYINGVAQPTLTCNVSISPFTTISQITGGGNVCPGATQTFTLTNSSSYSNVVWSIAQSNIATVQSFTNSTATVSVIASGTFTIKATIQNACGQTANVSKTLSVGVPYVNPNYNTISGVFDWYSTNYPSQVTASVYSAINATSYVWSITGSPSNAGCYNTPKFLNGSTTITTYTNSAGINFGGCTGGYTLWCKPKNSCGISNAIIAKYVTVGNASDSPCDNSPIGLKMTNPVKENEEILLNIHDSQLPCDFVIGNHENNSSSSKLIDNNYYNVVIYDFFGRKVFETKTKEKSLTINNENIQKGKYIVMVSNNFGYVSREILLVE